MRAPVYLRPGVLEVLDVPEPAAGDDGVVLSRGQPPALPRLADARRPP
ncbi:hypothetical protein ACTMTF_04935 [Nonomuraea sp. ZG12]